jgi:hypothetical protein
MDEWQLWVEKFKLCTQAGEVWRVEFEAELAAATAERRF